MSLWEKTNKRKHGVFLFPEEKKLGSAPTSKIVEGVVEEGQEVKVKWHKLEIPANILRLSGTFFLSWYSNADVFPAVASLGRQATAGNRAAFAG